MKIIVHEKELKALFEGLAGVLRAMTGSEDDRVGSGKETEPQAALLKLLRSIVRKADAREGLVSEPGGHEPSGNRIKETLSRYQGRIVELTTQAGMVAGEIESVGGDYVKVAEGAGTYVLIPLEQIVSFHIAGKQVTDR